MNSREIEIQVKKFDSVNVVVSFEYDAPDPSVGYRGGFYYAKFDYEVPEGLTKTEIEAAIQDGITSGKFDSELLDRRDELDVYI